MRVRDINVSRSCDRKFVTSKTNGANSFKSFLLLNKANAGCSVSPVVLILKVLQKTLLRSYNRIHSSITKIAYTAVDTKLLSSTGHRGTVSGDRVCPRSVSKLQCKVHPTMVHPPRPQYRYLSNPMELGETRG